MIDVEVEDQAWLRSLADVEHLTRQAAQAATAGAAGDLVVLLTNDAALRALNLRFLGKDRPTNVLAFPDPGAGRLGDIALAHGVCVSEALEQGKPLADHLRHLVVHGALHLMGYDHQDDAEAAHMEALERELLARMNIADPYAEASRR
jgi:probable rRNA maturation factor